MAASVAMSNATDKSKKNAQKAANFREKMGTSGPAHAG